MGSIGGEVAAAASAGVVLGWDVPALAGPLAATMAAPPGAPALLPWLADDARFDAQQLDTAHHAMSYLFGALGFLIEPLFDVMFSFLYRKTDYFHVMKDGDKIGFREGVAKQLLLRSFDKFEQGAAATAKRAEAETRIRPPTK